ncbi:MAG: histidine kinase [Rhodospirillales bacterium]|nr:MAG: histidine kinase [Rhodospirillales bacterium]
MTRWRPRLRTVLLAVNLALLALPLGGVWFLRVYESALLRQTESELIGQGVLIAAQFRAEWLAAAPAGALAAMPASATPPSADRWQPIPATLDLADDPVLPAAPAAAAGAEAEPVARRAGAPIRAVLLSAQRHTLAGMRIVDAKGVIVASTEDDQGRSLAALEEVASALRGAPASALRARDAKAYPGGPGWAFSRVAEVRVHVAIPVVEDGRILGAVALRRTPRTLLQALWGKRYHLAALAALLFAAGGALAVFTALTVSRPVAAAVDQARRVAAGERDAVRPLPHRYTREVADLSASLDAMARTLERRADYIRDFAAEIGHEFKTPLASMRGAVELLRDDLDAMSPDDRRRFLDNLGGDVARLDRLTRRLLELARADAARPAGDEKADVGAVARALAERFRDSGPSLRLAPPDDDAVVAAIDPESLSSALACLVENARDHAGPGATATIGWSVDGALVRLRVADDGPGISAGNRARVFDRFFTTARDAGGTGLGLPIARGRLAAFGGTIRLLDDAPGAVFEIDLPRAA